MTTAPTGSREFNQGRAAVAHVNPYPIGSLARSRYEAGWMRGLVDRFNDAAHAKGYRYHVEVRAGQANLVQPTGKRLKRFPLTLATLERMEGAMTAPVPEPAVRRG